MNPAEPIPDLMRRTMYNLRIIEQQAAADGPYEVTQLVNSFLGALAHPWEQFREELNGYTLKDAAAYGWPEIRKLRPTDEDPTSTGRLLQLLRNAIAHGNIAFQANPVGEIAAVELWNTRGRHRTWGTIITVTDMRRLLDCFVALAEDLHGRRRRRGGLSA